MSPSSGPAVAAMVLVGLAAVCAGLWIANYGFSPSSAGATGEQVVSCQVTTYTYPGTVQAIEFTTTSIHGNATSVYTTYTVSPALTTTTLGSSWYVSLTNVSRSSGYTTKVTTSLANGPAPPWAVSTCTFLG